MVPYAEPLPMYSPMSPLLSPVVFAYPVVYPTISPTQPFAPPAVAGHLSAASPDTVTPSHTPKSGPTYSAMRPNLTITPISPVQPSGMPYTYSPHRVVDGTTLENREHESGPQGLLEGHLRTASAARAVVRPVSTPPAPIQGPEAGVARVRCVSPMLFASEICMLIISVFCFSCFFFDCSCLLRRCRDPRDPSRWVCSLRSMVRDSPD